jgi:hypothetical protein
MSPSRRGLSKAKRRPYKDAVETLRNEHFEGTKALERIEFVKHSAIH